MRTQQREKRTSAQAEHQVTKQHGRSLAHARRSKLGKESDYVRSLSFSNDGQMLVTGHMSDDVKVWNVRTGKLIRQFKQPFSQDDQVAFSPDGEHVVSGGENQNIMLWHLRTGKLIWAVIPIDWEAGKRAEEEAQREAKISAAAEAERKRKSQEADKETSVWEKKIQIIFEHFGERLNPLEQHMMEKGEPSKSLINQSAETANGVWLRLRNHSPLPIKFRTDSFYMPRPNCGVKLTNGANGPGVCDGSEVSIQYGIEEADGKPVRYGLDFGSESILPPGASVLFSVARVHLRNSRTIFVGYAFLKENDKHELEEHGSPHRASFRSSQLRSMILLERGFESVSKFTSDAFDVTRLWKQLNQFARDLGTAQPCAGKLTNHRSDCVRITARLDNATKYIIKLSSLNRTSGA